MVSVLSWVLPKGTETCGIPGRDNDSIVSEEYTYQ
jgi:hypothetical protein